MTAKTTKDKLLVVLMLMAADGDFYNHIKDMLNLFFDLVQCYMVDMVNEYETTFDAINALCEENAALIEVAYKEAEDFY